MSLDTILDGIDRTEDEGGWWETSVGAEFGAKKLVELKEFFNEKNKTSNS